MITCGVWSDNASCIQYICCASLCNVPPVAVRTEQPQIPGGQRPRHGIRAPARRPPPAVSPPPFPPGDLVRAATRVPPRPEDLGCHRAGARIPATTEGVASDGSASASWRCVAATMSVTMPRRMEDAAADNVDDTAVPCGG